MARPTEAFVRCLAAERIRRGLIQLDANVPGWMAGVKLHSTLPRWPVPVRRIISSQATSALLEGINALYDGMTYLEQAEWGLDDVVFPHPVRTWATEDQTVYREKFRQAWLAVLAWRSTRLNWPEYVGEMPAHFKMVYSVLTTECHGGATVLTLSRHLDLEEVYVEEAIQPWLDLDLVYPSRTLSAHVSWSAKGYRLYGWTPLLFSPGSAGVALEGHPKIGGTWKKTF